MLDWPQSITVVDDTESVEHMESLISDLSWLVDDTARNRFLTERGEDLTKLLDAIRALPVSVRELAATDPNYFAEKVTGILIFNESDVKAALRTLEEPGESLAFIDFDYSDATNALPILSDLYEELDPRWRISAKHATRGGCVFSSAFNPTSFSPLRLLCPTTYAPPPHLKTVTNNAVTEHMPLQGGFPSFMEAIIIALSRWVELQQFISCPLDRIWSETENWFRNDLLSDGVVDAQHMPHDLPVIDDINSRFYEVYRKTVEGTLGVSIPSEVWSSENGVYTIHESLKHMCGFHYCGRTHSAGERKDCKNLVTGSAYLIALLAMHDAGDYMPLTIDSNSKIYPGGLKQLFPVMRDEDAREAARVLYHMLLRFFKRRQMDPLRREAGLKQFVVYNNGANLAFELSWSGQNRSERSLSDQIREAIGKVDYTEKERDHAKLTRCVRELADHMLWSSVGFGSPGSIWMEDNILHIASVNET